MKKIIKKYRADMKGKKVAVLGIGISNTPLIKYLSSMNADITAFDRSEKSRLEDNIKSLDGCNVKFVFGERYLEQLKGFDIIFRTPGMRYDLPELVAEKERGAEITSEMEVFFQLCPAKIFGVTGSDGKTTTTTLIYTILKEEGYNCWLGGNIGIPLLSKVEEISDKDMVVLELSSFQLHTMKESPPVSVITNLSPNHLDIHKSMEEYVEAKKNIFKHQDKSGRLVLNLDNEITAGFKNEAAGDVLMFSRKKELDRGAFLKRDVLVYRDGEKITEVVKADEIVIPGLHNVENYLAAIAALVGYVKPESIRKVAMSFGGVEHRLEFVRELKGIKFYNGSIDSSPNRTKHALNSFKQKVILIAGGKDKNIPYDEMGPVILDKVKCLVLTGSTADKIEKAMLDELEARGTNESIPVYKCTTYEEAVNKAYSNAKEGDIVILSPASTSFDMFKNFEERGRKFKEIVLKL